MATQLTGQYRCPVCSSMLSARTDVIDGSVTQGLAHSASYGIDLGERRTSAEPRETAGPTTDPPLSEMPPPEIPLSEITDDWDWQCQLGRVHRLTGYSPELERVNAEMAPPMMHDARPAPSGALPRPEPLRVTMQRERRSAGSTLATLLAVFGFMTLLGGGVTLGVAFFYGPSVLWNVGWALLGTGNLLVLVALVVQLSRLRRSHQQSVGRIESTGTQLSELQRTTSLLTTQRSSASQSFYAHFAEGAQPHILLADLKGQLDLLATRMVERQA